jgi:type VI protein secretion system component Hcp
VIKTASLRTLIVTALASMRRASLLGIIALGLAWTTGAQAQTKIFLTWQGIVGPSKVPGFQGSIELTSYMQNASNNGVSNGARTPVCGAITVVKFVDDTSPDFLGLVLQSQTSKSATVSFARSTNGGQTYTTFYSVSLNNVLPISVTQSDAETPSVGGLQPLREEILPPIETIVFSATQFRFSFGNGKSFGWDCSTNSKI